MTNGEKYKTVQERAIAFNRFCAFDNNGMCEKDCVLDKENFTCGGCAFHWLELEAKEEKPLPCPFCGNEMDISASYCAIVCPQCGYRSPINSDVKTAIAAHNKVAKKCME